MSTQEEFEREVESLEQFLDLVEQPEAREQLLAQLESDESNERALVVAQRIRRLAGGL